MCEQIKHWPVNLYIGTRNRSLSSIRATDSLAKGRVSHGYSQISEVPRACTRERSQFVDHFNLKCIIDIILSGKFLKIAFLAILENAFRDISVISERSTIHTMQAGNFNA